MESSAIKDLPSNMKVTFNEILNLARTFKRNITKEMIQEEKNNEPVRTKIELENIRSTELCDVDKLLLDDFINLDDEGLKRYADFNNMNFHRLMVCLFSYLDSIHDPDLNVVSRIQFDVFNKFLKNITPVSKLGLHGMVVKSDLKSIKNRFVVKYSRRNNSSETIHEAFVGLFGTNELRYYIPNFAMVYGLFECGKMIENPLKKKLTGLCNIFPQTSFYVVYEDVSNGMDLKDFLHRDDLTLEDVANIVLQISIALNIAYKKIGFTHYDLHGGNVLIKKLDSPVTIKYAKELYLNTAWIATIIDYGRSRVQTLETLEDGSTKNYTEGIISTKLQINKKDAYILQDVHQFILTVYLYLDRFTRRERYKTNKMLSFLSYVMGYYILDTIEYLRSLNDYANDPETKEDFISGYESINSVDKFKNKSLDGFINYILDYDSYIRKRMNPEASVIQKIFFREYTGKYPLLGCFNKESKCTPLEEIITNSNLNPETSVCITVQSLLTNIYEMEKSLLYEPPRRIVCDIEKLKRKELNSWYELLEEFSMKQYVYDNYKPISKEYNYKLFTTEFYYLYKDMVYTSQDLDLDRFTILENFNKLIYVDNFLRDEKRYERLKEAISPEDRTKLIDLIREVRNVIMDKSKEYDIDMVVDGDNVNLKYKRESVEKINKDYGYWTGIMYSLKNDTAWIEYTDRITEADDENVLNLLKKSNYLGQFLRTSIGNKYNYYYLEKK